MCDWILANVAPNNQPYILDIGTGNGNVVFALLEAGYSPERLLGIDYSATAVQLSRSIASSKGTTLG